MSDKLHRCLAEFDEAEVATAEAIGGIDTRAWLIVTVVFLVSMLSLQLTDAADLLLMALYPIAGAALTGVGFGRLVRRSLVVLPFVLFVGIFNPVLDTEPAFEVGHLVVSRGWVTFFAIVLRGMLSVQAVLLLVYACGFFEVCRAMGRLGVPQLLTAQMMMLYRYIFVTTADAAAVRRSVVARQGGRSALSVRTWSIVVGGVLIRSVERAERIGSAMEARGFDGRFRLLHRSRWQRRDTLFTAALSTLFIALRVVRPAQLFNLL